jgi:hypothetical protein
MRGLLFIDLIIGENYGYFIRRRNSCAQDVSSMWRLSRSSSCTLAPVRKRFEDRFIVRTRTNNRSMIDNQRFAVKSGPISFISEKSS